MVGDIRPDVGGLEVFFGVETPATAGNCLGDLESGEILWSHTGLNHVHGGWAADVDPDHDGWECYGFDQFDNYNELTRAPM